jgi:glycosyltransferase involved in cell wall biosynthesis
MNQLNSLSGERCFIVPHLAPCYPREQPADSRFLITHAGGLLPQRKIDTFLLALRSFLDEDAQRRKETVFRVIGPNAHLFRQKVQEYGVADVSEHLGEVPFATCMQYLHRSTVLLLVEAPMPSSVFLPSKLADYAGSMRPILAVTPRIGCVADYIREFGGGLIGDVYSPQEVSRALSNFHASWSRGTLESDFPTERLREQFSEAKVTTTYKELLRHNYGDSMACLTEKDGSLKCSGTYGRTR